MPSQGVNLFLRIIGRNPKVYFLKIISLALAFASSTLVILFALNEFRYDSFHTSSENIFRVIKRNNNDDYNGNRYSTKIPSAKFLDLQSKNSKSATAARVSILNGISVSANKKSLRGEKIHAADEALSTLFTFEILHGNLDTFTQNRSSVLVSASIAERLFGTTTIIGKPVEFTSGMGDTLSLKVAAVFEDLPSNSHEGFQIFIRFDSASLQTLGFSSFESGVYLRADKAEINAIEKTLNASSTAVTYSLQPLTEIYFGRRMIGEEANHGDSYSVLILACITGFILLLALTNYVILTTLTLPYRSKELAVKKLAGTSQLGLVGSFFNESFAIVVVSFVLGLTILILSSGFVKPLLAIDVVELLLSGDLTFIVINLAAAALVIIAPLVLIPKFIRASPSSLLGASRINFPKIKRTLTVVQLGVSMLVLVFALVMKRQIQYSLVKEPGRNNDQVVYLDYPSDLTQEGLGRLREGWRSYHPNILDVLAASHLPHNIISKEVNTEFYTVAVDPMFPRFFGLNMTEGNWYRPNASDSSVVVNARAMQLLTAREKLNVLGVLEDVSTQFNAPQKPVKFRLAKAEKYNYLFIRILEVDIRRTVNFLATTFDHAEINFLDSKFQQWLVYQDRLNTLSNLLAIVAAVLSCFAIYGLALSFIKEKMKQLAVHKIYGAGFLTITLMLVKHFGREMLIALLCFAPLTYILTTEMLRNFAYATSIQWHDPLLPILFSIGMIVGLSGIQALRLNIKNLVGALKS